MKVEITISYPQMTSIGLEDINQLMVLWSDVLRFTIMFLEPISFGSAHIYASALPHCPETTQLWMFYGSQAQVIHLQSIKSSAWPADIWTRGIDHPVNSVSVSPNGKIVASGSDDNMIRLWDVQSGVALSDPLTGHSLSVSAITFSPDGNILASASSDRTMRLWDLQKGIMWQDPLEGHLGNVSSLAFSPDGKILASGSYDCNIRLWDVQSGTLSRDPLTGHTQWFIQLHSPQMELSLHQDQGIVPYGSGV